MSTEILTPDQWSQIDATLANGEAINAMRLYREYTGLGLAAAKGAIYERARLFHPTVAATMGQIAEDEGIN